MTRINSQSAGEVARGVCSMHKRLSLAERLGGKNNSFMASTPEQASQLGRATFVNVEMRIGAEHSHDGTAIAIGGLGATKLPYLATASELFDRHLA
ncbi:MAG: hypothetical protein AUG51_16000 [Acidobacteria bacterium 13_1_20CM_3_53_8]|nr:MAG: hypothetical protein AUG51_16000 [Acidobacteria bacterium 13_1_20CM_3_53_8]